MDSDQERQAVTFLSGLVLGAVIGAGGISGPDQGMQAGAVYTPRHC